MLLDRRKSRCYMKVEEKTGRRRCSQEIGESVTRATCCCTIGKAWGPRCELCPQEGSEEYKFLCPNNNGYRPNSITVSYLCHTLFKNSFLVPLQSVCKWAIVTFFKNVSRCKELAGLNKSVYTHTWIFLQNSHELHSNPQSL